MLQNKDIAKIQEIKALYKDSWIGSEFFREQLSLFEFSKSSKIFQAVKNAGVPFLGYNEIALNTAIC